MTQPAIKLPALTLIPASAGSGKTYTIETRVADWVAKGLVAPERIIAVTFTEAAAAELRGRLRARLLKEGRVEDALRLEQAYISTIHGFGLRLLTEYAFESGLHPAPRKLDEHEESLLLRRALARTTEADVILERLWAFGYRYQGGTDVSAEQAFRNDVLKLIGLLRSIGEGDPKARLRQVEQQVRTLYGESTAKEGPLNTALLKAVQALLKAFPHNLSGTFKYQNANKAMDDSFQSLKELNVETVARDWELWQRLRKLFVSQGRTTLPEGYDALAQAVIAAANSLPGHPGPLNHALGYAEGLLGASMAALGHYATDKRTGGLLDYSDMVALAHRLLDSDQAVLTALRERVDCLVIDEFQDTNPLQFALLWLVQASGVPALMVGDVKQSIMGFQNADPRLMQALVAGKSGTIEPLTGNWRCSPKLLAFLNATAQGLFGKEYTPLTAEAKFKSKLHSLEVIEFTQYCHANLPPAQHTAARLRALLNEGHQVWDPHAGTHRPLRPGDIAVLCRTNALAETYATALRQAGLRPRLSAGGWLSTREVRLATTALAWVANPGDRHAALSLAVTELGRLTLQSGVQAVVEGRDPGDPLLELLRPVAQGASDRDLPTLVAETLEALDLYGTVMLWPDAAQARANLLRLEDEAAAFVQANRDALEAGRFNGAGIKTFLAWLADRTTQEDGDAQPEPQVLDEDAIEITTWHSAKGREWPVVAVCGTDYCPGQHPPDYRVAFADFKRLDAVLDGAAVEIFPAFAALETAERFREPLRDGEIAERLRLLYVALTRARECLILEWQSHRDGKTYDPDKRCEHTLLKDTTGLTLEGAELVLGKQRFPCRVTQADRGSPPGFEDADDSSAPEPLPRTGRRALVQAPLPEAVATEFVTPSALAHGAPTTAAAPQSAIYGTPLNLGLDLEPRARGILLHRCFEVLSSHPERAVRLAKATGYEFTARQAKDLSAAVAAFDAWLATTYAPHSTLREVPFLVPNAEGRVVSGVMDLLVETEAGWWILDHKSDETDAPTVRFADYLPQLRAYADAVRQALPGKPVLGVGVNWVARGEVVWKSLDMKSEA